MTSAEAFEEFGKAVQELFAFIGHQESLTERQKVFLEYVEDTVKAFRDVDWQIELMQDAVENFCDNTAEYYGGGQWE